MNQDSNNSRNSSQNNRDHISDHSLSLTSTMLAALSTNQGSNNISNKSDFGDSIGSQKIESKRGFKISELLRKEIERYVNKSYGGLIVAFFISFGYFYYAPVLIREFWPKVLEF